MDPTSARTREQVARSIRRLVATADEPRRGAGPPVQADDVLAAADELLGVARHLEGADPVSPRAVALAAQLVWDSASPVYAAGDFSVWEWARAVEAA